MAVFIVGFFDVLRAGFAERRTTAGLNGELVAKAPGLQKYCVRLDRGCGTRILGVRNFRGQDQVPEPFNGS